MAVLHATKPFSPLAHGLETTISDGFFLRVELLEEGCLRIALEPDEGFEVDRTWMIAPDGDVPWEGRDRLSVNGFTCPGVMPVQDGFQSDRFRVRIEQSPLRISVAQRVEGKWLPVFEDRDGSAYHWFEKSRQLKHFQHLQPGEAHYGLGDKTGPLDRTGRRLRCLQSDALGYDAERSDPLYKHAPWIILSHKHASGGLLYDTMAETVFDLGAEHSNYFERYRHVEMHEKGMVLYVLAGPDVCDVVPRLHDLTGKIAFPPRWSLGFAFTTMHHADAPDAQRVITDFAHKARERELPISAIHLGSGYTRGTDGLRYVFNWDRTRFPDRDGFFADLQALGFRTCANIKPVLLTGHPSFARAQAGGWFVRRANGEAAIEMFWGGEGASLDFTNSHAIDWWQAGVSEQVLGAGFDAVWNDNNEAELWDETATLNGFGKALPGMESRPVHALLMTRASHDAMMRLRPEERPYTISRAGPIGIGRYGETWSGDNATSWHSLKWNLRQGLSMSLSGMPLVGHDIGGFAGPPPNAELLVRWFQMMALHPRCVMNSWKVDHDNVPNLPWMHEDVFDHIKAALRLRYRFLPLIYSLAYDAHRYGHPVIAPTFYHFDDPACRTDNDSFMLGPDVLVAPVVNERASTVDVYLPASEHDWVDYQSGLVRPGGEQVTVEAPLDRLPVFVRGGSVLPLAKTWDDTAPHDARKVDLTIFYPGGAGRRLGHIMFDDGIGWGIRNGDFSQISTELQWNDSSATFRAAEVGNGSGLPQIEARLYGDTTVDFRSSIEL